jgi:transposase-like protein
VVKGRNRYSKEFKFKVALEAIRGEKQIAEIATEFKVHANMIGVWKRQLLERGAEVFETGRSADERQREEAGERLVNTIGHQQIEIDWLKKKLGLSHAWRDGV